MSHIRDISGPIRFFGKTMSLYLAIRKNLISRLSSDQKKNLLKLKEKVIKIFSYPVVFLLRLLPAQIAVAAKEDLKIIKKLDYDKADVFLVIESRKELPRIFSCKKEPETIHWIEAFIKPGDTVYDIGANIGVYSLIIDKFSRGLCVIYAFEPSFSTFRQLNNNIIFNKCNGHIFPYQIGLSDKTELAIFNYSSMDSGAAIHALGKPINHMGELFEPALEQQILSYRLDDLVGLFGFKKPNHIKLDVDGIEYNILNGAKTILASNDLRSLLVEVEPSQDVTKKIVQLLKEYGFKIHGFKNHGRQDFETANYIFARSI